MFDRWERVWHEGQYDLIPECVAPVYIRHDEAGDRTVTREAYEKEIAKARQERPHTRFVVYDVIRSVLVRCLELYLAREPGPCHGAAGCPDLDVDLDVDVRLGVGRREGFAFSFAGMTSDAIQWQTYVPNFGIMFVVQVNSLRIVVLS
jgi:hypothetical protein